jgi:hypothetical protein
MTEAQQALSLLRRAATLTQLPRELQLIERAIAALEEMTRKERADDGRDAVMRDPFRHRRTIGPEHLPGMVFE